MVNQSLAQDGSIQAVFETERLRVHVASANDTDHYYKLWTDPRVMGNVGYPSGLPITREQIASQLQEQTGRIFDCRLIVLLRDSGEPIGECKLGRPNPEGISTTDVKLMPKYWGNKYGVEIKRALVDHLFRHTSCTAVEATPNVENIASIKMQEAVGGVCVGEEISQVPESKKEFMVPVHHYIYRVFRDNWIKAEGNLLNVR